MTNATYLEWSHAQTTLDAIGAWATQQMAVTGADRPERIRVAAVTPGLLTLLQAVPLMGRSLVPGDEEPGHAPVLLLSHALWQQRFGEEAPDEQLTAFAELMLPGDAERA